MAASAKGQQDDTHWSTEACSWMIIWQLPDVCVRCWVVQLLFMHWEFTHVSASAASSPSCWSPSYISAQATGTISFPCPTALVSLKRPLEPTLGKANHIENSKLFVCYTTRCPSATNYLFSLIQSCAMLQWEAIQSSQPGPNTSLAKAAVCILWEPEGSAFRVSTATSVGASWRCCANSFASKELIVCISPAGHHGGCPAQPPPATRTAAGRLVHECIPEAEGKRTYLAMLWGPSPHSRKKHQLQTSSPPSQPPLPPSPVKGKGERAAIKRDHGSGGTRPDWSPNS